MSRRITTRDLSVIRNGIARRSIVLVGLMGAGKSTVGRRLASRLGLIFKDADIEIEAAAGLTIPDIFATAGRAMIPTLIGGSPARTKAYVGTWLSTSVAVISRHAGSITHSPGRAPVTSTFAARATTEIPTSAAAGSVTASDALA